MKSIIDNIDKSKFNKELAKMLVAPIRRSLNFSGIGRKLLMIEHPGVIGVWDTECLGSGLSGEIEKTEALLRKERHNGNLLIWWTYELGEYD